MYLNKAKCIVRDALESCAYRSSERTCAYTHTKKCTGPLVTFLHQSRFCKKKDAGNRHQGKKIGVWAEKLDVELPSKGGASMTKRPAVGAIPIFWTAGVTKRTTKK